MTFSERLLVCGLVLLGGTGTVTASEGKGASDATSDGQAATPVNFADPQQLLARRQRGEQPCTWESYDGGQIIRCEAAVDGAVQLVVKATGRIYDSLKKRDPGARKVLDASTAAWWKYFKQCDLFALDPEVIKGNGQLAHHGGAGRCRYGILADRLRELLEFEELVKSRGQRSLGKK
jgi:hypothetical protein